MKDFSGQGKVYLATRLSNGKPGPLTWVDDASTLQFKLSSDKSERTESWSGQRLTSATINKSNKATFALTLSAFSSANLALGLYGQTAVISAGTVTAESLPSGLKVGDIIALDHRDISDLVITDSAAQPKTLAKGVDYVEESLPGGLIAIKALGTPAYTQPFKTAYSYGASANVTMFTSQAPERYLYFDGINTVDGSRCVFRLYRCKFDPLSQGDLISDDFGKLDLGGSVLFDSINAGDPNFGGFGRIEMPSDIGG